MTMYAGAISPQIVLGPPLTDDAVGTVISDLAGNVWRKTAAGVTNWFVDEGPLSPSPGLAAQSLYRQYSTGGL